MESPAKEEALESLHVSQPRLFNPLRAPRFLASMISLAIVQHHEGRQVLCPVCKQDYLVQAGTPSSCIVCVCNFRLDVREDQLGLEHLRQQLAETYEQHRQVVTYFGRNPLHPYYRYARVFRKKSKCSYHG